MMIPRSLCALVILGGAVSGAMAAPGPQALSAREMDAVTAGAGPSATITSLAGAAGDVAAFATTAGTTYVASNNSISNNPASTAYVAVGAGTAAAVGAGNGAATSTSVTPTANVPGTTVTTYTINQHIQNGNTELTVNAVAKVGTFVNPWALAH